MKKEENMRESAYPHGGDIYSEPVRLDFSVNTNPYGMPPGVREAVLKSSEMWTRYPDCRHRRLREAFSSYYRNRGLSFLPEDFLFGNGASDLIYHLVRGSGAKKVLCVRPSFGDYERAALAAGAKIIPVYLREDEGFSLESRREEILSHLSGNHPPGLVILGNPNNPTGRLEEREYIRELMERGKQKNILFLIDECFLWFSGTKEELSVLPFLPENAVVVNAFTKIFSAPGLRFGYAVTGNRDLREKTEFLRQSWSVSAPAEEAAAACLQEEEWRERTVRLISAERERMSRLLSGHGFTVFPSRTDYLLFRQKEEDTTDYAKKLLSQGILIRQCGEWPGLRKGFYRTAVRLPEENDELLRCLYG